MICTPSKGVVGHIVHTWSSTHEANKNVYAWLYVKIVASSSKLPHCSHPNAVKYAQLGGVRLRAGLTRKQLTLHDTHSTFHSPSLFVQSISVGQANMPFMLRLRIDWRCTRVFGQSIRVRMTQVPLIASPRPNPSHADHMSMVLLFYDLSLANISTRI